MQTIFMANVWMGHQKEMVQYNAALVITGANQIYRGLGLEFLADWRWFQKVFFVTK